jgi:hypothetical protein
VRGQRRRTARVVGGAIAAAALLSLCLSTTAPAAQVVSLSAAFEPYRLGGRTTVALEFGLTAPPGQIPSTLTQVEVRYPKNLGFALSGLGLDVCPPSTLAAAGASGCPANSIMGHGTATAELRFGSQIVTEGAAITIARAPDQDGFLALLLYVAGPSPVNTQILSPAQLLPAGGSFGGRLHIELPLVPSVPGAPDVAIVQLSVTLGPQGLTYFETVGGQTLAYRPRGILLPNRCPRGGFPFAGAFTFADGSRVTVRKAVSCPRRRTVGTSH